MRETIKSATAIQFFIFFMIGIISVFLAFFVHFFMNHLFPDDPDNYIEWFTFGKLVFSLSFSYSILFVIGIYYLKEQSIIFASKIFVISLLIIFIVLHISINHVTLLPLLFLFILIAISLIIFKKDPLKEFTLFVFAISIAGLFFVLLSVFILLLNMGVHLGDIELSGFFDFTTPYGR
jgi:hypothetical protein